MCDHNTAPNNPDQPGPSATPSLSGKFLDTETWDAMKATGFSDDELHDDQPLGPIIFSYTRKQAIEDGVLVDVTSLARQRGFKIHTVITCAAVAEITCGCEPTEAFYQSAILATFKTLYDEIRKPANHNTDRIHFRLADLHLWSLVGPGDEGEPVLTIMLESED